MRILSAADSTDLLFGDNKIYDFEKLKIYDLDTSDSTFYLVMTEERSVFTDTLLTFDHVDFMVSRIFIDFGDSDIDTLDINFITYDTECCGDFTSINSVNHNGTQIYNDMLDSGSGIVQLMK